MIFILWMKHLGIPLAFLKEYSQHAPTILNLPTGLKVEILFQRLLSQSKWITGLATDKDEEELPSFQISNSINKQKSSRTPTRQVSIGYHFGCKKHLQYFSLINKVTQAFKSMLELLIIYVSLHNWNPELSVSNKQSPSVKLIIVTHLKYLILSFTASFYEYNSIQWFNPGMTSLQS